MSLNLAIIGAGSIGAKHAEAALAAGMRLGGIVDRDADRAAELATKYSVPHFTTEAAVLSDPAVQAVVIGVPNRYHRELAVAALRAGKDVLLEKPMAMCERECEEIAHVAASTGRLLQMGFVHRYTAVGRLAHQLVQENRLGNIYQVTAQVNLRRGVPGLGKWFTTKELSGGGALIDIGVHLLDLGLYLLGYPNVADVHGQVHSVFGRRMRNYVFENMWAGPANYDGICDVEDSAHAFIRFDNGVTFDLHVSWAGNFPEPSIPATLMAFFGERGGMSFELFGDHVNLAYENGNKVVDERIDAPETMMFRDQLLDFDKGIKLRRVLGAGAREGTIVQSIVDRIYQSSIPYNTALCG